MISLICRSFKNKQNELRYGEQIDDWGGRGKIGEGGQKVQTSIYNISRGDVMYSMVTIVNNTVVYIWKLLKIDLKSSHHEKKNYNYVCWLL